MAIFVKMGIFFQEQHVPIPMQPPQTMIVMQGKLLQGQRVKSQPHKTIVQLEPI